MKARGQFGSHRTPRGDNTVPSSAAAGTGKGGGAGDPSVGGLMVTPAHKGLTLQVSPLNSSVAGSAIREMNFKRVVDVKRKSGGSSTCESCDCVILINQTVIVSELGKSYHVVSVDVNTFLSLLSFSSLLSLSLYIYIYIYVHT